MEFLGKKRSFRFDQRAMLHFMRRRKISKFSEVTAELEKLEKAESDIEKLEVMADVVYAMCLSEDREFEADRDDIIVELLNPEKSDAVIKELSESMVADLTGKKKARQIKGRI